MTITLCRMNYNSWVCFIRQLCFVSGFKTKKYLNEYQIIVKETNNSTMDLTAKTTFITNKSTAVDQSLLCFGSLHSLRHTTDRVVYRSSNNVALISGGGSGHEPAHVGFIGNGMLTAAVCGSVFASPSTSQVYSALKCTANDKGTLIIVKNYTGDRLSFGRAMERWKAANQDYDVRMVIVNDDCAIPRTHSSAGRRGLAATVFVHKIAGYLAELGRDLDTVHRYAQKVIEQSGTVGVCLTDNGIEIGLGIHGESGFEKLPSFPIDDIVKNMIDKILSKEDDRSFISYPDKCPVVLMVNNLGATTPIELNIFTLCAIQYLESKGHTVKLVVSGMIMTALSMQGVSITLLTNPDDVMLEALQAKTDAEGWPGAVVPNMNVKFEEFRDVKVNNSEKPHQIYQSNLLSRCLTQVANVLIKNEPDLTKFDTLIGDGDCGLTLKHGSEGILEALKNHHLPIDDPVACLLKLSEILEVSMGGSSGVLYCILLDSVANSLLHSKDFTPTGWVNAFKSGLDALSFYGGAVEGDRTMLDALYPFHKQLAKNPVGFIEAGKAALAGAENTKSLINAKKGRASYVNVDLLRGTADPGAYAVGLWAAEVMNVLASEYQSA
ncbi:hypothetical protein BC833DRAFT_605141 [Globomyces pollinis-pini]|nr:hypothetical protein BC833DRAFT_605141 [Globomyces pollinis-pini]